MSLNSLGPRLAAALSLRNPLRREVTVSNDPGIQLKKSIINTKRKFQLTSYFSQFAKTVFLYIQQVCFFFIKKKRNPKSEMSISECQVFGGLQGN